MATIINVIEPTLSSQAGHCFSFVNDLCKASDDSSVLRLWVGRNAGSDLHEKNIQIRKYFFRRIRRFQSFWLYKKLLATPGKIFISTAGRTDLALLNWSAQGVIPPKKAYLYFHWFNSNNKKLDTLRKLARKQPNLEILGPTASVVQVFKEAGFSCVQLVPYPVARATMKQQTGDKAFSHLLYAGAARQDKGFGHVVDLVAYLQGHGIKAPVVMQISGEHYGKYDSATLSDIRRLKSIAYPELQLQPETLGPEEYAGFFAGAICLQLYNAADFADRVSGVTLDALSAGAPVVATAGTWIARIAKRFEAGIEVKDAKPTTVWAAIQTLMMDYGRYSSNASIAGNTIQEENSAKHLYRALLEQDTVRA